MVHLKNNGVIYFAVIAVRNQFLIAVIRDKLTICFAHILIFDHPFKMRKNHKPLNP